MKVWIIECPAASVALMVKIWDANFDQQCCYVHSTRPPHGVVPLRCPKLVTGFTEANLEDNRATVQHTSLLEPPGLEAIRSN